MTWIEAINEQTKRNRQDDTATAIVEKQKARLKAHLRGIQLCPLELIGVTIVNVRVQFETATFITDQGKFCMVEARGGYDNSIDLDEMADMDFEEAVEFGLMPREMYKAYEDALEVRNGLRKNKSGRASLESAIDQLGKDMIREILG